MDDVISIALRAGDAISELYDSPSLATSTKSDQSPLTEADLRAHRLVASVLAALTPSLPILSEEAVAVPFDERSQWERYWLVDPLDGTRNSYPTTASLRSTLR